MIEITCAKCDTELEVPATLAGKRVKCPECGEALPVPAAKGTTAKGPAAGVQASKPAKKGPAPAPAGPKSKAAPPRKAAAKPQRPPAPDEDDDEDEERDERPRGKGKAKGKGKEKSGSGSLWILLGVGGGVGVLALIGLVVVVLLVLTRDTPSAPVAFNPPVPPVVGGQQGGAVRQGGPLVAGGQPGVVVRPGEGVPPAETPPKAPELGKTEEPPLPVAATPAADGQKIYRYLLKSTALIINVMPLPDGHVAVEMGSGALVDTTNKIVVTNYHVVNKSAQVLVFFPTYKDGKLIAEQEYFFKQAQQQDGLVGKVAVRDATVDLAVLKLEKLPDGLRALPLATTRPAPGSSIYSVGHPGRSGGLWVYTEGKVRLSMHKTWQAMGVDGKEILNLNAQVLLTDSPTNPGDSGGPLVNGRGELVAITQGSAKDSNLLSIFVDLSEVKTILDRFAQTSGTRLVLEKSSPIAAEADSGNLPDMIRALDGKDATVRANAARALGELGPNGKLAVAGLLKALHDQDDLVRKLALEALTKIGTPDKSDVTTLVTALKDRNTDVRAYAAGALGQLGTDGRSAVRTLLEVLKDQDLVCRQSAARALGKVGADARDQVQSALAEALKDPEAEVRAAAAEGLAALPMTAADVPTLVELLKHKDTEVREQGALALKAVGREARTAVKPLTDALQDRSGRVRRASLEALARMGPDAKEAVPGVQKALKDPALEVRRAALDAVAAFGPDAKDAARAVADALDEAALRQAALVALTKIGPAAAHDGAPAVAATLAVTTNKDERLLALDALTALKPTGPEAKDVVPRVVALFETADRAERDKAAAVLGKIGKPAVAALQTALGDTKKPVRLAAAQALGEIGAPAKSTVPLLNAHAQQDQDPDVRQACAQAITKIQQR